jgi:hypothetical protein
MTSDLLTAVKAVLLKEWDPIGINDVPTVRDEYDSYAPEITRALQGRATAKVLATRLLQLETEVMGLKGDPERAERVARALLRLAGS